MAGLSQSDLENFMAFTATYDDPEIARDYLTNNNNELQRAVDEWFKLLDPNYYKNRPKHGPANQMQEMPPSFEITAPDVTNKSRPPSRPPSRAQHVADWNSWDNLEPLTTGAGHTEDIEMQQALERSRLDQVPTASAAPKVLDPEPKGRIRQPGHPAFLRPLPNGDFLPSLISILRTIPSCRNELLSKDDFLSSYEWNDGWWEGEPIQMSRISSIGDMTQSEPNRELIHEVQRLIAFLEGTNRAYGSVDQLVNIILLDHSSPSNTRSPDFIRFLKEWEKIATSESTKTSHNFGPTGSLFMSQLVQSPSQSVSVSHDMPWQIHVSANQLPAEPGSSLYEALDTAILGRLNEERVVFYQQFAPILLIVLEPGAINRSISVPEFWYADRYLEHNWDFIKSSRSMIQEELSRNEETIAKMARIETFGIAQASQRGDALKLINTAMKYLQNSQTAVVITENDDDNSITSSNSNHEHLSMATQAFTQLQDIQDHLQARLKVLTEEKTMREERIRSYAEIGTRPDEPQFPASVRYQLRGVATSLHQQPTVTCAINPQQDEWTLAGLDNNGPAYTQWWNMIYDTRYAASVRCEKCAIEDVIAAAGELKSNTLLVYAHEDFLAADKESVQIPPQLQAFVERDNSAFYTDVEDPFAENPVIEGLPVDDGKGFDSGVSSETLDLDGGPGPSLEVTGQSAPASDPTIVEGNDVSPKLREMEEIGRPGGRSPKKRKSGTEGGSHSSMETMNPDSDIDMV